MRRTKKITEQLCTNTAYKQHNSHNTHKQQQPRQQQTHCEKEKKPKWKSRNGGRASYHLCIGCRTHSQSPLSYHRLPRNARAFSENVAAGGGGNERWPGLMTVFFLGPMPWAHTTRLAWPNRPSDRATLAHCRSTLFFIFCEAITVNKRIDDRPRPMP